MLILVHNLAVDFTYAMNELCCENLKHFHSRSDSGADSFYVCLAIHKVGYGVEAQWMSGVLQVPEG